MNNKWRNHSNQEALCILFHKERWKKTNNDVNDTAYSNETIPDSIMLNARGAGAAITTLYPSHSTRKAYNTITYFGNIKWK